MRSVFAFLLLACLLPRPATSQVVRGVVLEEGTGTPIEGAMVVVLDAGGRTAARTLTDATGRFLAQLGEAGGYRVRIDRIGYASLTTDAFDVTGAGVFRRISVPVHAIQLKGLDVSGARRCEVRPEVGRATAVVWEEARKALQAAAWTLDSDQYRYRLLHFVRHLDRDGRNTLDEYRDFSASPGRAPYVSRAAESLADSGFVQEMTGGRLSYFAPDADVLLSDTFLDTHCMRLTEGDDSVVGLAFEPVKGRKLPDIEGVLWMDAATAALTRLEFEYVNLDRGPAIGDAGGEVRFGHLPTGTWIVREWHVRMPLLQHLRSGRYERSGYQEEGGVVWRVTDRQGSTVYQAVTATARGRVLDSLGAPLPGVSVRPRGLDQGATTDADGAWVLDRLPEGQVKLDVTVPFLDTLGLGASVLPLTVELAEGGTVTLDPLRTPGVVEALADACGDKEPREGTTTLLGHVRTSERAPAGGVRVLAGWAAPSFTNAARTAFSFNVRAAPLGGPGQRPSWKLAGERPDWLETTLDARGIFLFCDAPSRSQLRVLADREGRSADVTVDLPRGVPVVITTLTLPPEPGGGGR